MIKLRMYFAFVVLLTITFDGYSQDKSLLGFWCYSGYSNGLFSFEKCDSFYVTKSGIEFKPHSKLIKRQNKSWCGTPPIEYLNYKGKWKWRKQQILKIKYDFWGGKIKSKLIIKELTDKKLIFEEVNSKTKYKTSIRVRNLKQKIKHIYN